MSWLRASPSEHFGCDYPPIHYSDVIMDAIASQVTSLKIVYSSVYSGADQTKHPSPASLAFLRGIHRWPVNFPHKGPVTREMFPFNDVIMSIRSMFCELSLWLRHGWNHTPQNTWFVIIFPHPNLMLFIGEKIISGKVISYITKLWKPKNHYWYITRPNL